MACTDVTVARCATEAMSSASTSSVKRRATAQRRDAGLMGGMGVISFERLSHERSGHGAFSLGRADRNPQCLGFRAALQRRAADRPPGAPVEEREVNLVEQWPELALRLSPAGQVADDS